MSESNGRVKLPVWVVVWATGVSLGVLGAYVDIRVRLTALEVKQSLSIMPADVLTRKEAENFLSAAEETHMALRREITTQARLIDNTREMMVLYNRRLGRIETAFDKRKLVW